MTTLLLDVMDTLVWDPYRLMPEFFGCGWEELALGRTVGAWHAFERDQLSEAEFLGSFFADGRAFDHAAFVQMFVDGYRFLPGIDELRTELSAAGVPMHSLSNYPRWSELIEAKLALSRFLSWDWVSWKTGHRKPEPAAYTGVAAGLGLATDQCLFVDDRESNCEAARAVGMRAVRFEGAGELRDALVREGVLPTSSVGRR